MSDKTWHDSTSTEHVVWPPEITVTEQSPILYPSDGGFVPPDFVPTDLNPEDGPPEEPNVPWTMIVYWGNGGSVRRSFYTYAEAAQARNQILTAGLFYNENGYEVCIPSWKINGIKIFHPSRQWRLVGKLTIYLG